MAVLKVGPNSLPGLRKHFEERRRSLRKQIAALDKKRKALEAELRTMEDGINWCEATYALNKNGGPE